MVRKDNYSSIVFECTLPIRDAMRVALKGFRHS
jgi:hypothetical protein